VEEMSLPNSRRQSHGGITITSGVEEMSLSNSRRQSHGYLINSYDVKEILTLFNLDINFSCI
jgi:hypothetical protein